jgi:hypothetical protein
VIGVGIFGLEVLMRSSREDSVDPGLLVLMPWSSKSGPRQLLSVKPVGCLLRGVLPYREGAFDGFRPRGSVSSENSTQMNFAHTHDRSRSQSGMSKDRDVRTVRQA